MSLIRRDCYWSQESVSGEPTMVAVCEQCQAGRPGIYWRGSTNGYGDYDLKCHRCGAVIHQRGETYQEGE